MESLADHKDKRVPPAAGLMLSSLVEINDEA
jgi:hypothetical protein